MHGAELLFVMLRVQLQTDIEVLFAPLDIHLLEATLAFTRLGLPAEHVDQTIVRVMKSCGLTGTLEKRSGP